MKITCPKCGEIIEVKGLGRKPKRINFINVSKALQYHLRGRLSGKVHYTRTAERLKKEMEIHPEVAKKLERIKRVYLKSKEE